MMTMTNDDDSDDYYDDNIIQTIYTCLNLDIDLSDKYICITLYMVILVIQGCHWRAYSMLEAFLAKSVTFGSFPMAYMNEVERYLFELLHFIPL